jgi:Uma2 family endonuclease
MATVAAPLPSDALLAGESKGFYEIVNGERREIPPMGSLASLVASTLAVALGNFVRDNHYGLMYVENLFTLRETPLLRRQPDIACVAFNRLPNPIYPPGIDPAALDAVPNLAVEVVSPTDRAGELDEKVEEYFDVGVECVWLIYPLRRRVYVYAAPLQVRILTETHELDGGDFLPGFRLPVAALFQTPTRPT